MKKSQTQLHEHSEIKVEFLKKYLEKYLSIMMVGKYFNQIDIFDLFCGEGIYTNKGKGSPIVILETINNLCQNKESENYKIRFNCNFNDIDKTKIKKLEENISQKDLKNSFIGEINFSNQDYSEIVSNITEKFKHFQNNKTFIFIDPYGYKNIKITEIEKLLENKNSEVLLFLPTQFMFRFIEKSSPECLIDFIEELVPKEQWPRSNTGIDFIVNLNEILKKKFSNFFVDNFIITRSTNSYFCLFFFTSHIYGLEKMIETNWDLDINYGRGASGIKKSLFDKTNSEPDTSKLKSLLIDFLKIEKTNKDIYEFTLRSKYLPKHAKIVLKELQKSNKLNIESFDGSVIRKGAFYINYDSYKEQNFPKIKIRLK